MIEPVVLGIIGVCILVGIIYACTNRKNKDEEYGEGF